MFEKLLKFKIHMNEYTFNNKQYLYLNNDNNKLKLIINFIIIFVCYALQ